MAKYQVLHHCGHTEEHDITGKVRDREYQAKKLGENRTCRPCFLAEAEAKSIAAAEANANAGLPALAGSPKQVPWAESIRAEWQTKVDQWLEREVKEGIRQGCTEEEVAGFRSSIETAKAEALRETTKAREWIDSGRGGMAVRDILGPYVKKQGYEV